MRKKNVPPCYTFFAIEARNILLNLSNQLAKEQAEFLEHLIYKGLDRSGSLSQGSQELIFRNIYLALDSFRLAVDKYQKDVAYMTEEQLERIFDDFKNGLIQVKNSAFHSRQTLLATKGLLTDRIDYDLLISQNIDSSLYESLQAQTTISKEYEEKEKNSNSSKSKALFWTIISAIIAILAFLFSIFQYIRTLPRQ